MGTRRTSTLRHQRLILCALLLVLAVVVAILHTTRVTGSSVPGESTIAPQNDPHLINVARPMKTELAGNPIGPNVAEESLVSTTSKACRRQPSAPVDLARCI